MGITNKPVYINIARPSMYAVLYAKQSDVNRAFTAVFNNDGEAWAIPENAVVSIWYRGAAGEGNYTKGIEINGNTAVVPLIPQMLSVPGTGLLCIIINTAAGDQIGTWNIPYFVEEIPGGNSEAATEFYTAFSEIASEVADYALEAKESARAAAASANEVSSTVSINPQALTEEQQAQARANIGAIGAQEIGEMGGTVSYAAQQNLSEGQQTQARENIGAAATANLAGCWIDFTDENGNPTDEPYLHWEEGGDGKKPDTTFSELLAAIGSAVSVEAQGFTEAQKAQARANIGAAAVGAGGGAAGNAVLYDAQYLTEDQQKQARNNIGAASTEDVEDAARVASAASTAAGEAKTAAGEAEIAANEAKQAATNNVTSHNTNTDAHADIRAELKAFADRLNAVLDSDDTTLDELSEIVAYIKSNKSLIDAITISKVNVSDIVDNLATNVANKPLSAAQGVALKVLVDAVSASLANYQPKGNYLTSFTETDPTVPSWAKQPSKPQYTASEVGARPDNWMPSAADVGALPASKLPEAVEAALGYVPANVEDVFENTSNPQFTNIFDTVGIEYGKYLNIETGEVSDVSANLATTDFIPCKANDVFRVNEDFPIYNSGNPAFVMYGTSKEYLKGIKSDAAFENGYYVKTLERDENGYITAFQIVRPSATGYIRICNNTTVIGKNPVLTINEEIVYENGYGAKLNPKVRVDQSQIVNAPQKNGWSILPYERLNIAYSSIGRKPINTVEHFTDAATNFGYNALKCDVRPTSDGELVCCHDAGFTFDGSGYITAYDSSNQTVIHDVTAATVLGYSFKTGEHPCLVGDYLDVCRKYGKVAFITIRNEYMDVVIPKLLDELKKHNMTYSTIINCMTYNSLVTWRTYDKSVMINYTLNAGAAIDQKEIDRAIGLGYCSLCGFGLNSSVLEPNNTCDFEYARANGIRLLQAIAYKDGSPEACYELGYDGCQIAYAWNAVSAGGITEEKVDTKIASAIGGAIGGSY